MLSTLSRRLLRAHSRTRTQPARKRRLDLQNLEDRSVPAVWTVNDAGDAGVGDTMTLTGDLRFVMTQVTANLEDDTIQFAGSINAMPITLASALPTYTEAFNLKIQGNGQTNTIINGNNSFRIFNISVPTVNPTITITGMKLLNGRAPSGNGGAILTTNEPLTIDSVTFEGNGLTSTSASGGAIATAAGSPSAANTLTISNSTFLNNSAGTSSGSGGAIHGGTSITINLANCNFTGNTAGGGGGAINGSSLFTMDIQTCTFTMNSSGTGTTNDGGAINAASSLAANPASLTINNSTFTNNTAGGNGGAINGEGLMSINATSSVFNSNTSGGSNGGAIAGPASNGANLLEFTSCTISMNKAAGSGGGIGTFGTATITLTKSLVSGNSANGNSGGGGGIYTVGSNTGALTIDRSSIINNTATGGSFSGGSGGAIYTLSTPTKILNSTLSGNVAVSNASSAPIPGGGAIRVASASGVIGAIEIRNSTISNNTASNLITGNVAKGGAILINTTTLTAPSITIYSSVIAGNNNASNRDLYLNKASDSTLRDLATDYSFIGANDGTQQTITGSNNTVGTEAAPQNPGLHALGNYGKSLPSHGLWYNGPLVDQGDNPNNDPEDQRLNPRTDDIGSITNAPGGDGTDIGAVEGFETIPFIREVSPINNVTTVSASPYVITVTYDDETGINTSALKLNTGDLLVTGPRGFSVAPTFTGFTTVPLTNKIIATYEFLPADNAVNDVWDITDGGIYTVALQPNEVFDLDIPAQSVPGKTLGTFNVVISGTILVDEPGDLVDTDFTSGNLTLREALSLSNNSVGSVDTITFAAALNGSPILHNTDLSIEDPVVIQGNGIGKTILSGNLTTRIFSLNIPSAGAASEFKNMSIIDGRPAAGGGGAILMTDDALTLDTVLLDNNQTVAASSPGGAISSTTGSLTIVDSTLSNNSATSSGGAINVSGTTGTIMVNITRTNIVMNTASGGNGGGINMPSSNNQSFLNLVDSTVDSNIASANGGGLGLTVQKVTITGSTISNNTANGTSGGGGLIWNTNSDSVPLTITNSTISGNNAAGSATGTIGGGIRHGGSGTITLTNVTITNNTVANTGNGGGLAAASGTNPTWNFSNTVIAQNNNANFPDLYNAASSNTISVNAAYSFIGLNNSTKINIPAPTNQFATIAPSLDAQLSPLAVSGGFTKTHVPLTGSPLIDQGKNDSTVTTDQRGLGRTFDNVSVVNAAGGDGTDIGAVEVRPLTATIQVNDGSLQRSMVTSFSVTFNQPVTFVGAIDDAFTVARTGPGSPLANVNLDFAQSGNTVVITFDDPVLATPFGSFKSLIDGRYTLTLLANKIQGPGGIFLDGDGNGTSGDNQTLNTHRIFGDSDGNGVITSDDFAAFRGAFGVANPTFDFDGDGNVDSDDFSEFRKRFGINILSP